MTQVVASNTNNIVKVYSVGVQGATGPSGSLQENSSGSFSITGSLTVSGSNTFTNIGPAIFSGSVISTGGFTGSLSGSISNAETASYALTASYVSGSVSNAISASHALNSDNAANATNASLISVDSTGANVLFKLALVTTGTGANKTVYQDSDTLKGTYNTSTNTLTADTFAGNATTATSSSYASTSTSASHALISDVALTVTSASHALVSDTALTATSASFSSTATSASFATTASFALNTGTTVSTASLLITGSVTNNVLMFTKGDGSTFNLTVDTGSAVTVNTGSLMVTGSANSNTLTFTKGDGSTFNLTVATGSAVTTPTSSLMVTGSVNSNTLTFTKGDGSTFNLTVNTGSSGGSAFPFSGSAIITGSLIISGSDNPILSGDIKGFQVYNSGNTTLKATSKNAGVNFTTEGSGPNSWYLSTTATQFGYAGNIFIHTTGSGMGNGSILGSLNWGQSGNDSFGSIKGFLQGVNQSTIGIYSSTFGALGYDGLPDISFISASLIDVNRKIETDQDIEITDSSKGIILKSSGGSRYRVTVDNSGNLITTSI
jgi:hypothetical protein